MRLLSTVLTILFSLSLLFAGDTGKIAGKIIDKATQEALPGANIIIVSQWIDGQKVPLETPLGASTDVEGEYFIINVQPGKYDISVIYVGYKEILRTMVPVSVDKTTWLDFELEADILSTEEILVVAHQEDKVEVDVTATKQTYNVSEVENLPGIADIGDIVALQADVSDGHFRGGRQGEAQFLVGGSSIVNPLNNSQAFEPITLALEQVEVYTSGFSAEYGNVQSGVINMVTKEGNPAKWISRLEMSSTNPYYKTFGGSVYSKKNLDFYSLVNDPLQWVKDQSKGKFLWESFDPNLSGSYGPEPDYTKFPPYFPNLEDSLRIAEIVRVFAMQSLTAAGLEYDKPDYRFDFSTGGPLNENTTMFIAGRQDFVQTRFPTPQPDLKRQIMSNIVYRLNPNNKFKFSINYDNQERSLFSSTYYEWLETVFRTTKRNVVNYQLGLEWNHVIDNSGYFDTKLHFLNTDLNDRVNLLTGDEIAEIYVDQSNWRHYILPSNHEVGKFATSRGFEKTNSINFNTSFNKQINKRNLIKAGLQFNYYDIQVNYDRSFSSTSSYRFDQYHMFPYEGALYLQDKIEFEGLIANVGIRYDFYNFNTKIYDNIYAPYRVPGEQIYDKDKAPQSDTELEDIIQPRIGLSFPVSNETVLHINYGVFFQRPAFQNIGLERSKVSDNDAQPAYERLGNPRVKPERTLSYDFGVVRSLPLGFYIDISAYLKDVSDLIQTAYYVDAVSGAKYLTVANREYADIKGFHVNLEKSSGVLRGYLRYNFEEATGKSAGVLGSGEITTFTEGSDEVLFQQPTDDIFLDYDRSHKALINLSYVLNEDEGWDFLNDLTISSTYRIQTGRPYTYDPTGLGVRLNKRTPTEHDLKLRIEKRFKFNSTEMAVYMDAFNILNDKVYDYDNVFDENNNDSVTNIGRYEQGNLLLDQTFFPYNTRTDAWAYGNTPRHYRFGVKFKF